MIEVVLHAELAANQLGDAARGPHVPAKAKSFGPLREQCGQLNKLLRRQSRQWAWPWAVAQSGRTSRASAADPLADRTFGDPQRCRNVALLPALFLELPGAESSLFPPI